MLREQGIQFAKHNKLFFLDECSAYEDINVNETVTGLVNAIYNVQKSLIEKGLKDSNHLKVNDEDMSLNYEHRCCY